MWPHEAFDRVAGQKDYKQFTALSESALAAGMIRSLMYQPEFSALPDTFQMQIQHMSTIFHALVASENLPAILEFQKSILFMLERGQLRWSPEFSPLLQSMQIKFLANLRQTSSSTSDLSLGARKSDKKTTKNSEMAKRFDETKATFCSAYQKNECQETGDHNSKKHLCMFCYGMRNQRQAHTPEACPSKPSQ